MLRIPDKAGTDRGSFKVGTLIENVIFCFNLGGQVGLKEGRGLFRGHQNKSLGLFLCFGDLLEFSGYIYSCITVHSVVGKLRVIALLNQSSNTMHNSIDVLKMMFEAFGL